MKKSVDIIGSGLAGLIAATILEGNGRKVKHIFDARTEATQDHQALLRFRCDTIARLTGIPFKKVKVDKEVWIGESSHKTCSIAAANMYSRKVCSEISRRSVANLEPDVRYIAPRDFYYQLLEKHRSKLHLDHPLEPSMVGEFPVISTAPMPANLIACGHKPADLWEGFTGPKSATGSIMVHKYKLDRSDVYQTVYFPESHISMYRASITGDVLTIESILSIDDDRINNLFYATRAFGIEGELGAESPFEKHHQFLGKMVDMPAGLRNAAMYTMTRDHGLYSLGRFATWRNILLDDVAKDVAAIERLIDASSYDRLKSFSQRG